MSFYIYLLHCEMEIRFEVELTQPSIAEPADLYDEHSQ